MNIGLSENSNEREKIVVQDENTAIKYRVVEQTLNLQALRDELARLEAENKKPTDTQLIELGKSLHPYYQETNERILEIKNMLGIE